MRSLCILYRRQHFPIPTTYFFNASLSSLGNIYRKSASTLKKDKVGETHRCAESSGWIPAFGDGKTVSAARGGIAPDHVGEADVRLGVDPGVQEAERGLSGSDTGVVEQGDDAGHQGS